MWTAPQIGPSPRAGSSQGSRGRDRFDEGRGKQEWGIWWGGKEKGKKEGKGDVRNPDVTN
jgi:hypothetical protein